MLNGYISIDKNSAQCIQFVFLTSILTGVSLPMYCEQLTVHHLNLQTPHISFCMRLVLLFENAFFGNGADNWQTSATVDVAIHSRLCMQGLR